MPAGGYVALVDSAVLLSVFVLLLRLRRRLDRHAAAAAAVRLLQDPNQGRPLRLHVCECSHYRMVHNSDGACGEPSCYCQSFSGRSAA